MLVDIANRSARDGHDVQVCITRHDDDMASELSSQVRLHVLRRTGRYDVAAPWRFAQLLREQRPDVIHLHARTSLPFVALGKLLARAAVPILLHDHFGGIEIDTSVPRYFRVSRRAIAQYVGVCDQLGDWAKAAGVPEDRVSVIENAIDLDRFRNAAPADLRAVRRDRDVLVGVMVANQHFNKGIEVLLDAVAKCRYRDRIHVVVAGEAPDPAYSRSLHEHRDRLGLAETVSFLGARPDIPELLRAADFALHTSHTESGPLVLVEYMAGGVPFVATRTGSIGKRLSALGLPGFVPPGNSAELAAELDRLLALSPEQRQARAAAARALLERWDLRSVMKRWYELYEHTAGNGARSRRAAAG